MRACVILNPYAGRWAAKAHRQEAEDALKKSGISYDIVSTERPGHGTELAEEAVRDGYSVLIAAGGDGSISEVVNGMMLASHGRPLPPLGILPLGSANDLAKNFSLPLELDAAAKLISQGEPCKIDLGEVIFGPEKRSRFFDNNSAIGLEPTITLIQQEIRRLRGVFRYLLATLIGIMRNPQWQVELTWDAGEYNGPATLVTVGNSPLTGGLFYMTPHAKPQDGLLTFVHGSMQTRMQILGTLPRTMKPDSGSYVELPDIHEIHTTNLRIRIQPSTPLHADGEIQSLSVTELEYRVRPQALPLILNQ